MLAVENIWTDFAKSYDDIVPELPCYQRIVRKILAHAQDCARIIDAGCGTGLVSELLVAGGHTVFGIDNNEAMLARAFDRRAAMDDDARDRWSIVTGSVTDFPPETPACVGAVVLNNVLFYVREPDKALRECRAHLDEGGLVIATGPRHRPDAEMVYRESMAEWEAAGRDIEPLVAALELYMDATRKLTTGADEMVTFFQPDELVDLLKEIGFSQVVEASDTDYYGENFYVCMRK